MNTDLPECDLLRSIDPAPHHVPADAQVRNLRAVLGRVAPTIARRSAPRRPWLRIAVPVLGVAAAAAVVLPLALTAPTPHHEAATTATAPVSRQPALTAGSRTHDGTTILARTSVGDAEFLIGRRDDDVRFGVSLDGSDPDDNWEAIDGAATAAPDAIVILNAGNVAERYASTVARVGHDIVAVEVLTHDGSVVRALPEDGYVVAAWEGSDFSGSDVLDPRFRVHLRDGTSSTYTYLELTGD